MVQTLHPRQGIRDLPEILSLLGVEKVILCPGSRSAPLTISFAKYGKLECLSIVDERAAAYFALGIAQYSQNPVAIVCTSGTAVLNLAPAIAEAYYQNIPLIVLTADRPKEWIDQADGQTIRQQGIFANYIKASYEIPGDTYTEDDLWYANRTVSQAIITATTGIKGPVHINIPLREPLYSTLPENFSGKHLITSFVPQKTAGIPDISALMEKWDSLPKKWVIVGVSSPNPELKELIEQLSVREDVLVVAENISNVSGSSVISTPDSWLTLLSDVQKENFRPDLLITIGHSIVSKKIKQYLRKYTPTEHWQVGNFKQPIDTYKSLTKVILADAPAFLSALIAQSTKISPAFNNLPPTLGDLKKAHNHYMETIPYGDLKCIGTLLNTIPTSSLVHLSNSTPVRYSQLFDTRPDLEYYANRGTSGIDGCTSTAAGAAYSSERPTVLITGDLAFLYDSNALWNNYTKGNFKVVVMNNNGGNIFSLIDTSPEIADIKQFFTTPHTVKIRPLAEAFGFTYFSITAENHMAQVMNDFLTDNKPSVLEIVTDHEVNIQAYKGYFKYLLSNVHITA